MLGKLDVVKNLLTALPEQLVAKGPHGISLLKHAKAGGSGAVDVVAYLTSLGAVD